MQRPPRTPIDDFFASRQATAILKLELVKAYLPKFFAKTRVFSTSNEVAFIDGFAGTGAYTDGSPGSALIAATIANDLVENATVRDFYIERKKSHFDRLCTELRAAGRQLDRVFLGDAATHLPDVLEACDDLPLFVFLDPYGLNLPARLVADRVLGRSVPGPRRSKLTEALLFYSDGGVKRCGAVLAAAEYPGREGTLKTLDEALGGDWWRTMYGTGSTEELDAIRREYAGLLSNGKWHWVIVPVAHEQDAEPLYHLIYFTQSHQGTYAFGEALSFAYKKFVAALDDDTLFAGENSMRVLPEAEWIDEIERNARRLLNEKGSFSALNDTFELFGEAYGLARTTHLRTALKRLHTEKLLTPEPKGRLDRNGVRFTRVPSGGA